MKKKSFLAFIAFLALSLGFMGCSKSDEETIGPDIEFADGITETTAKAFHVSVTITSSVGLKEVVIDRIVDSKIDGIINTVTEFENSKKYTFEQDFSVSQRTLIRFTATDKDGQKTIESFTFNIN